MTPSGWERFKISELLDKKIIQLQIDGNHGELYPKSSEFVESGIPYLSANCIVDGVLDISKAKFLTEEKFKKLKKGISQKDDVLFAHNATVGPTALNTFNGASVLITTLTLYRCDKKVLNPLYLKSYFSSPLFSSQYTKVMAQSTRNQVPITTQREFEVLLPPLKEQEKIAKILTTWDEVIEKNTVTLKTVASLKQSLLQQIIYRNQVYPKDGWILKPVSELFEILDNRRKPLNSEQRQNMQGDIPYYGANGQVGTVDKFIFDEPLILLAEDGGYFDEYRTRPIAYRIIGKSWVNNHAHVLKARSDFNFDYLYFALVHKNIMPFLNGGTRAKLNKGVLEEIEIPIPKSLDEQIKISNLFNSLEAKENLLKRKSLSLLVQKQGLMQQLLTGKKRVKV